MLQSRTRNRFLILPPGGASVPKIFRRVESSPRRHALYLAEMQRLRGRVYLADGAIQPCALSPGGRHHAPIDEQSWHVLSLDARDNVIGCLRYFGENHAAGFDDLWVRHAAIAASAHGGTFRRAVQTELARARQMALSFGEVGGWAVAEEHRSTLVPVTIVLATYALLQLLGGCAGMATATFRHRSAGILRRIGLEPLIFDGRPLPPYYDPQYDCQMEVLKFDSRFPSPKYRHWVDDLTLHLCDAPVLCGDALSAFDSAIAAVDAPLADEFRVPEYAPAA